MAPGPGLLRHRDVLFLPLARDGRVADEAAFERLEARLPAATDCIVFCHGWLDDPASARREAARFFALLEGPLRAVRERAVPLRMALHWPSKPFGDPGVRGAAGGGLWTGLEPRVEQGGRAGAADFVRLLVDLCASEVPLGPEEELELDALLRRLRDGAQRGGVPLSPFQALRFWVMKRRAGAVGERLGRERLGPCWARLPDGGPRLHLVGHSFGASLLASAVLGGARPDSLTLLLAAFSAFAFAREVPRLGRPGFYHRLLAERQVRGPIVVLRSVHDTALRVLYPFVTGASQADRGSGPRACASARRPCARRPVAGNARAVVAASALGAVGARGLGAPDIDLLDMQSTGLPRRAIVNVDGSRVLRATTPLIGAHRDFQRPEVATLVCLAAGLFEGGPDGVRPRRATPFVLA